MSRQHRPYPHTSSRPPRAEYWQPDRPYGGGHGTSDDRGEYGDQGERGDYGDLGDYGGHEYRATRYDRAAPGPRRYAGAYAGSGRNSAYRTQVLGDRPPATDRGDDDSYGASYDAPQDDTYDAYDTDDDEIYEYYEPIDRRWVWVAGVAGAVLLIAVICTVVILGGGDSGAVSATVTSPAGSDGTSQAAPTRTAAPPAATSPRRVTPPTASLPAETVTTVAPTPSAVAAPPPPVAAVPVAPAPAPGTVTYTVSGTRSLLDLVTVIYTDAQGALQTDVNVALPWRKTVTLDPGVALSSVTATSITGQLNCSITDAAGVPLVAQSANSIITTCTR